MRRCLWFFALLPASAMLLWPQGFSTMGPEVRGLREMVAAANNQQAEAGFRLLTQGGNAVDAGVAATLTAAVTEQSRFGLGGEMPLLVKMQGQPVLTVSGVGTAPQLATVDFYKRRQPEPWETPGDLPPIPANGILAATVPGVFDGLILALNRFGSKSYCEVAQPAIEAAQGFPIAEEFASMLAGYQDILGLWPASRAFFFPDGRPPRNGEIVRYPTLARTLQEMCTVERKTRGSRSKKLEAVRDYFYKGPLARKIAAAAVEAGGLIRYEDLAGFRATIDEPRCATYREYEVCKPGFWSQGPVMIEALNILEGFDLKAMGHNSADYLHTLIEAVKLAFADRDAFYGDPKFTTLPEARLLSKEYAAERRTLIDPRKASLESRPGSVGLPVTLPAPAPPSASEANDTTSVNVVDRFGNVYSATPSGAWLPSVIAGDTGIPFGTRLQSFVMTGGHPNQLAPGKRPRITLSPTVVLRGGKPYLALSTPGGDNQDQALLQTILNIIEFGMTPQQAVEAPRFQSSHFYASFGNHEFQAGRVGLESRIAAPVVEELRARGHVVSVQRPWSNSSAPAVIRIGDGLLEAGADPRRARFAFGR